MRRLLLLLGWWVPVLAMAAADTYRFTDTQGRVLDAKILKVNSDSALVQIKESGVKLKLDFNKLSAADVEFLKMLQDNPVPKNPAKIDAGSTPDTGEDVPANTKLYPKSKEDIRAGIHAIERRPKPKDLPKPIHEAVQQLNIYRFLCGVPSDVSADAEYSKEAEDAAAACKENGGLSHELGHSTDHCNLTTMGDVKGSVRGYIEDSGDNNREVRGHREWCLNPPMGKVGFGSAGAEYSAMWCMDTSGKSLNGRWSYPGMGYFPLDYMHGNAWSLYGAGQPASPDQIKVEIFKLPKRPDKPYTATDAIAGRVIKVNHVSLSMHGINFEPDEPAKRGIYWVRVKGEVMNEGYLVELY